MRPFTLLAAGHAASGDAAMYVQDQNEGNDRSILLKPACNSEVAAYELLSTTYASDPVHKFIPAFHGVQPGVGSNDREFLRLTNLVEGFEQPQVMDVKLGMRTFLRSETQNAKPRNDLFQKMQKNFPSELTDAELAAQAVTKTRYMMVRDAQSTSGSSGYRVSGTAGCYGGPGTASIYQATVSETKEAASRAFQVFVQSASSEHVEPSKLALRVVKQLRDLRATLGASAFVREHECIGTSVLLAIDAACGTCRAFWIDFAKTCACKDTEGLSHREPLRSESQEEGLLFGIDCLINDWEVVAQTLHADSWLLAEPAQPCFCKLLVDRHREQISQAVGCTLAWLKGSSLHKSLLDPK